jgi:hypothetical protein
MSVYRFGPEVPTEAAAPVVIRAVDRPAAVAWASGFAGTTIAFGALAGMASPIIGVLGVAPLLGLMYFANLAVRSSDIRLDAQGISGEHVVRVGERAPRRQRWSVAWRDLRAVHIDRMDSSLVLHTTHEQLGISLAGGAARVQTAIIDYHDRLLREPRRRALGTESMRRALVREPVRFIRHDGGSPRVVEVGPAGLALELRLLPWEQVASAHKIFVGDRTGMVRIILRDGSSIDVDGRYDAPLDELAELIDPPFDKVEAARPPPRAPGDGPPRSRRPRRPPRLPNRIALPATSRGRRRRRPGRRRG